MDISFFIAKRLALSKKSSISSAIIRIAVLAIGISVSAMIIAVFMIKGFQVNISEKIFGFWGHIDIIGSESTREISLSPIVDPEEYINEIKNLKSIRYEDLNGEIKEITTKPEHIQKYIIFPAIISTEDSYEGLVLKGVGEDFDSLKFSNYLKSGSIPDFGKSNTITDIMISKYTADRLKLDVGRNVLVNFITENEQIRKKVKIAAIYSSGLMEYDKKIALVNIEFLRNVLKWNENEVGGIEVFIDDIENVDLVNEYINVEILPKDIFSLTARQKFPAIFQWLKLQNINEKVILILMLIVSVITMITSLLILILENTRLIGIIRALGSNTWNIRKIFLFQAGFIILFGLISGNFIGLTLCFLQDKYGFIKLDEASYYLSVAPVYFDFAALALINIGTLIMTFVLLIVPSYLVSKIDPIKSISFR
jgi:lipoprotein-releasing system permease protein